MYLCIIIIVIIIIISSSSSSSSIVLYDVISYCDRVDGLGATGVALRARRSGGPKRLTFAACLFVLFVLCIDCSLLIC